MNQLRQGIHRKVAAAVGQAIRTAPARHRYISFVVIGIGWYVCEYVFHAGPAAKGIEVFGLAPFADRIVVKVFELAE
jgi:hypothetical protein